MCVCVPMLHRLSKRVCCLVQELKSITIFGWLNPLNHHFWWVFYPMENHPFPRLFHAPKTQSRSGRLHGVCGAGADELQIRRVDGELVPEPRFLLGTTGRRFDGFHG